MKLLKHFGLALFILGLILFTSVGFWSDEQSILQSPWLMFGATFGLSLLGGILFVLPDAWIDALPGIKNNDIFTNAATNRGWIGWIVFGYLVSFYIILYFFPELISNQIVLVNPISKSLSGNTSSQWFLYGFIYCCCMTVMAIRMFIKYRHSNYQLLRTAVVLFFQIAFAFLIPEILTRLNLPSMDLKNAWPLDYDFFYANNITELQNKGLLGSAMLIWGILLTLIVVPVMVYFFGKRWYCSWVCGCGGLAETLGDPYRQLSDKSIKAWKIERWLIYSVLVFTSIMTVFTIGAYFSQSEYFLGVHVGTITWVYGFLIGSVFSGIIGTGFYPMLGNRSWCRFGCPLAAYMGIVQRYKSRFRITTNGGQCISCGNCSTYCEQGIDVRWYAQRGQNIVRSSCVGCGVCSSVCPRGVLNLENGPESNRINENPISIGLNKIEIKNVD
jgi:ferredoxin-type protein NapH